MADDNGNPFNHPLASETQDHQQAQAATVSASDNGNPFNEPLLSEKAEAEATGSQSGQITNDVGNQVIVPKEGEAFADTMGRAAAQGKQTTPAQVNAEEATIPEKAAQTLAAAAGLGVGGTAALAAPGELAAALGHLHAAYGAPAIEAITAAAKAHPVVSKLLIKGLEAAGGLALVKYAKIFGPSTK